MTSVTTRIKQIKQPKGGYIKPKDLTVTQFTDNNSLNENENINSALIGITTDYLTRYLLGKNLYSVFNNSIKGAIVKSKIDLANELLKKMSPSLDDICIVNAIKLSAFDVCYHSSVLGYKYVNLINPNKDTIKNIRILVNRCLTFFNKYGPITKTGFTFEGGYTSKITAGDADYLTKNYLIDLKVSVKPPTKNHTLQVLIYYLMGMHSLNRKDFLNVENIALFNPRLNALYSIKINDIDKNIINTVKTNVIGYK